MPQEEQSDCWVGDFAQSFEEFARLGDTFGRVSATESIVTYGAA